MKASFKFQPHDLWVGVFWDCRRVPVEPKFYVPQRIPRVTRNQLTLYVCLLPTLLVKLEF